MSNIQVLKTFKQKDVFPNLSEEEVIFEDRLTGKAIIVNSHDEVALVATTLNYIYTLPGGGIDEGETIEEGIIREAKEETGFNVKIDYILGVIEDYRNRDKKHCINYCAVAHVIGEKQEQKLTEDEKKNGLHVIWISKEEAYSKLLDQSKKVLNGEIEYYNTAFNVLRDFEFLKLYLNK